MRLVTFLDRGDPRVGVHGPRGITPTDYTNLIDLILDGQDGLARVRASVSERTVVDGPRLLAPLRPGKMLFCGINYPDHLDENPNAVLPTEPFIFSKLPSAIAGPGAPIRIPSPKTHTDYEAELAVVIGHPAKRVSKAAALGHVFGYTIANDVSARDVQFRDAQITLGKNADSFCPLGPEVATADELPDLSALHVSCYVNGERRQHGATRDWLFDVPTLIEFVTRSITLDPGDILTTGTPSGVAAFRDPPLWLRPGDEVTVQVDQIGSLTNPVIAGWQ